jgi:hypothetical protein
MYENLKSDSKLGELDDQAIASIGSALTPLAPEEGRRSD